MQQDYSDREVIKTEIKISRQGKIRVEDAELVRDFGTFLIMKVRLSQDMFGCSPFSDSEGQNGLSFFDYDDDTITSVIFPEMSRRNGWEFFADGVVGMSVNLVFFREKPPRDEEIDLYDGN